MGIRSGWTSLFTCIFWKSWKSLGIMSFYLRIERLGSSSNFLCHSVIGSPNTSLFVFKSWHNRGVSYGSSLFILDLIAGWVCDLCLQIWDFAVFYSLASLKYGPKIVNWSPFRFMQWWGHNHFNFTAIIAQATIIAIGLKFLRFDWFHSYIRLLTIRVSCLSFDWN